MSRELTADIIRELSEIDSLNHLDAYGGACFALDIDEVLEKLKKKGWRFHKGAECIS